MKQEQVIRLALAGLPNSEIAALVGSRPRRVREIIAAAIRAGAPIAPNADRMACAGPATGRQRPFSLRP